MMWVEKLQNIVRKNNKYHYYNAARNYLKKENGVSRSSILSGGPKRWLLGVLELHSGGGFDVKTKTQMGKGEGRDAALCLQRRRFKHSGGGGENGPNLDRDFLAKLWVADTEMAKVLENRTRRRGLSMMQRHGSGDSGKHVFDQPPVSQSTTGYLAPTSKEEALVAPLLARSNLLITRDVEWANLVFGFEQENRYAIVDVCYPNSPVGFIREQSNVLLRQFLRLRRPFVAHITDALGNKLFRIRRPLWWITSSIYAEVNGKEVGVVHQRWHLWRRIYDLYLGNKQFAVVENPGFWNWTFTLKDSDGNVLAQIDRDWRGFGFEIFTDAGQYVIRFGRSNPALKTGLSEEVEDLEVVRPLTLSERAVAVALAVSLDNDYFSRHGGWAFPFVAMGE